ncbi:MAG: pyruvate, phosphate dikinase [Spirochaetes bacterium]|nr:pyruvate, phosphate dikinase [Spirochaetota bacterium]
MYFNELVAAYDRERRERNIFHDLMHYRVREVLLVASLYDSFILESDGALSEQIYGEYYKLNLTAAPRVTCAYTPESAVDVFRAGSYDIVILMAGLDFDIPLSLAREMKSARPDVTILLLAMNNSSLLGLDMERPELPSVDRVFVWNGYSKLFVGMVKYVEDLRNVDADTCTGLVRVILLVEDSVRYYSRYLPVLYSVVMKQTQTLIEEERQVEMNKVLRMRGRPKVLLATDYDRAVELFERYEPYILTVISDISYPRSGCQDPEAGFEFLELVKSRKADVPVLIQSSDPSNRERAFAMGAAFVDKDSNTLAHELSTFFRDHLGFGPFIFRSPEGAELARARNMDEFEMLLEQAPLECVLHHAERNHFSAWLLARGEIRFARVMRSYRTEDFGGASEMRDFILRIIDDVRKAKNHGVIPNFDESLCGDSNCMVRLASGSVGGKGRGIVFIKSLIDNAAFPAYFGDMEIKIPFTAFVGIDEFERFLESNALWVFAQTERDQERVKKRFLEAPLTRSLSGQLEQLISVTQAPLAVRSSGLFEDMLMVPFSGIYDTYIIPNAHPDPAVRLAQLCDAIRLTYASLFSESARNYFEAASYKIEEERMAIVIQEVVGARVGNLFYPHISGTAQSHNYYPVAYLKPDDGLCVSAIGLGSYVVEGGEAFRFSPSYPRLDVVSPEHQLSGSQRWFYALDLSRVDVELARGEDATLSALDISVAESNASFPLLASTYDMEDGRIVPGISARGSRIVNFANILKFDALPFAEAIETVLQVGSKSMGIPVEIEYAVNLAEPSGRPTLYLLQIKPLLQISDKVDVDLSGIHPGDCLLLTELSMGNGRDDTISDIVFIRPGTFDRERTLDIAEEIGLINASIKAEGRRYILIGFGRWGTRDRRLGIPVSFNQISAVRAIVEADLEDFRVESSLGSHFFHNVTAMNIGYFSIPWHSPTAFVDWNWLGSSKTFRETAHCVHLRLDSPVSILMDGRKGRAAILKPGAALTGSGKNDNIACEES